MSTFRFYPDSYCGSYCAFPEWVNSAARWIHRELGADLGVDLDALWFEVEGFGCGGFRVGGGHGEADGAAVEGGAGSAVRAGVGEFEEGGDGGAECFGVLVGPLDGFAYRLLPGSAVDG